MVTVSVNPGTAQNPNPLAATVIFSLNNLSSFLGIPPDVTKIKDGTPVMFGNVMTLFNIYPSGTSDM